MIELNKIYNEDCLIGMKNLEDKSVDLIIADIPYNVTRNEWDKYESQIKYINFLEDTFKEFERVLKLTGSLYIFQNDFQKICEIQQMIKNYTNFGFRNLIVWNKKFEGSNYEWRKNSTIKREFLKTYQKYAEYILFYTFEIKSNSDQITQNPDNFIEYKKYIQSILNKNKLTYNSDKIVRALYEGIGYKSMQSARSISQRLFNFNYSAFGLISEKQYNVVNPILNFDKSYLEIYKLYSENNNESETYDYTFNNLGTHHSIWNYNNVSSGKMIHPTEKPEDMISNIIKYSSNENDIVLDPFCGSGVTFESCIKNNRNFIGFELDKKYYEDSLNRIEKLKGRIK